MNDPMKVIGLAGGIACGKSLVAKCFADLGCEILDADQTGHEVLGDRKVVRRIAEIWGQDVVEDGVINRSKLAAIVFRKSNSTELNDSKESTGERKTGDVQESYPELKRLEAITHPEIGKRILTRLEEFRSRGQTPAVILDAPVMFKSGWDQFCDRIVFIDTDPAIRKQRAQQRGWSEGELQRRELTQISLEEKRRRSTDVIYNSGTIEDLIQQIRKLWKLWNTGS